MSTKKPVLQRPESARNRRIRRDEATRRTVSSRSIVEYDKWIEGIKSGSNPRPGAWSSKILPNSKSMQFNRDEELNWHDKREHPDTDRASSPELWNKKSADESFHLLHEAENDCPDTRTREIEDYRKELMDMVRGLPEEDFELTLQDLVEKRKEFKVEEPATVKGLENDEKETRKKKNQKKYVNVARSNSIDTGLLTRMFKPLSIAVKRRKSLNLRDIDEKVATKDVKERKKVIERKKSKDEEWWRKNEFSERGSSNSSSVGSSSSNGSNSSGDDHCSRNMSMKQPRCACFRPGKSKTKSS